jgi:signal transduction histidine kinase
MAQTLVNIVNNAAKYTPAGGRIDIHFARTDTDITIDCLDNGIGIPKQFQEKIFMKFFQVEEASEQDKTGCGLGLSLCHEMIKKHGGYIDVESPLNPVDYPGLGLGGARKGSKFSIHLVP